MRYDDVETIAANSFRNFHSKGLDYICLHRSDTLTIKAYFFDNLKTDAEIVVPHDHRYDFSTTVLAGEVRNNKYKSGWGDPRHTRFQEFDYETPLNGGSGFVWKRETLLSIESSMLHKEGESYHQHASEIHSIVVDTDTVLLLTQFADKLPTWASTRAFQPGDGRETPSLDGLYDRFTEDQIVKRLLQLKELNI
jgi:hypothetical protein